MFNARSIMLVDDDGDDMLLFAEALRRVDPTIGFAHAFGCESANKLLHAAMTLPDCIFMDINMPKITGLECLAGLKKNKRFQDIPVVICTTSRRSHEMSEAQSLGASAFFTKPPSFDHLIDILKYILRGAPLRTALTDVYLEVFRAG